MAVRTARPPPVQPSQSGGDAPVSATAKCAASAAEYPPMMKPPRTSQLRHWGRRKMRWKRAGCSRSQIRIAPVSARKTPATIGAAHVQSGLAGPSAPVVSSSSGARYAPAAIDFVHV